MKIPIFRRLSILDFLGIYFKASPSCSLNGPDPPPPEKTHKNIGFLSNNGEITKLPSQHSMMGRQSVRERNVIGSPAKHHLRHMRLFPMRTFSASANGESCLDPVFRPLTDSDQHSFRYSYVISVFRHFLHKITN